MLSGSELGAGAFGGSGASQVIGGSGYNGGSDGNGIVIIWEYAKWIITQSLPMGLFPIL